MLQFPQHLCGPPFDSLQQFPVSFDLESPELGKIVHVWPHQIRLDGEESLSQHANHTILSAPQDAIGLPGQFHSLTSRHVLQVPKGNKKTPALIQAASLSFSAWQNVLMRW